MAKNLFEVVQGLFIPFVLLGFVGALLAQCSPEKVKRVFLKALFIVLSVVLVVTFLRERRLIKYNQINNIYLLCASLVCGLAFCICTWILARAEKVHEKASFFAMAVGTLFAASLLLYKVPVILVLPLHFVGMGDTYFSTSFLAKCTGFLAGLIICALSALAAYKVSARSAKTLTSLSFSALYLISGFISFVGIIGIINSYYRRKIKIPTALRTSLPALIKAEYIVFFAFLCVLMLLAVAFFMYHTKIHQEYSNPAEHRKLKAQARNRRRWALFLLSLSIFAWIDMTVIKKQASKIVELSPSESYQLEGNEIFIPLEQVSDGHLHRFTWTNESGKGIRFIIVQKKGMNFGVGFDACEVCGNVGYYERKNEIVCNRCDVVMNKSTIGLKGGCNPIPLASHIENGGIIVLTDDLAKEAKRF